MYTRRYDMGDHSIIMDTDDIIHQAFQEVLSNKAKVEAKSTYKVGQQVRMTSDTHRIANMLMPTYTYHDAMMIARSLSGQVVTIIGVDELQDGHNRTGLYYSIEDDLGMMYAFPPSLFSRY